LSLIVVGQDGAPGTLLGIARLALFGLGLSRRGQGAGGETEREEDESHDILRRQDNTQSDRIAFGSRGA
jgi:hypothetical protein